MNSGKGDVTAAVVRFGFPTSEYGSVQLRYTFRINKITPYSGAPATLLQEIQQYGNSTNTSLIGFTFGFNTLDDYIKPTRGMMFSLESPQEVFALSSRAAWYPISEK